MSEAQTAILPDDVFPDSVLTPPRAVIPDFVLTPSPLQVPSRDDFLIAEFQRRFNARRVDGDSHVEVADPEMFRGELEREPEWDRFGFRGQVGKLLWARGEILIESGKWREGRSLQKKAIRFVSCNKCARPGACKRYPDEHKFFVPNGCAVVFCKQCAEEFRRALFMAYQAIIIAVIMRVNREGALKGAALMLREREIDGWYRVEGRVAGVRVRLALGTQNRENARGTISEIERALSAGPNSELWPKLRAVLPEKSFDRLAVIVGYGWVLARLTFTMRSGGSEITPDRVKGFNLAVGETMRRTVGSRKGFGLLFVDEVGFEKRGHLPDARRKAHGLNLHCHGLYFGPRLDWERTRDLWMECTEKKFGEPSRGFYITSIRWFRQNPEKAVRWALNHMLKYLSKPPAVTAERLASLIAAFHTAKRVHSLGLFNGKKPEHEAKDCPCPKCKAMGIVSVVGFEGRSLPNGGCVPRIEKIEVLLAQGYVPLREAGRDAVLAMGGEKSP